MLNEITGYNASRRIFEEGTDIGEEIDGARASLGLPTFQIAVVVDVFVDPSSMSKEDIQKLESESATPDLCKRMPRNSISGRIITRNQDLYDSSYKIFFPVNIFDAEPVKPGEQVFIFYVDQIVNDQIGYWWKRVPQPIDTDDINFTHADRKYQVNDGPTATESLAGVEPDVPGFVNGGNDGDQHTLAGRNAYEDINKNAKANAQIIKEPVARFVKRPGDKVIQGSNAARIVLGMDRATAGPAPSSTEPRKNSATIDMVVGYGREGTDTAPTSVENSRGDFEVDKSPKAERNSSEGDPDMLSDPSRFYLSESTDPDLNFEVQIDGIPETTGEAPSAVIKTNRIRLLAGEDIKIVGKSNSIVLDVDGNISLVASPKINLGSSNPSEPVALGNALVSAIDDYSQSISDAVLELNIAAQTYFAVPLPTPPQQATFIAAWAKFTIDFSIAQQILSINLQSSLSEKVFTD